jgi:3-dehydroquinate synthetase/shikimate kinase
VVAVRGIYLVGFSGTGKSTVAQLIGAQLGWKVFDLDQVIAERAGMTIPLIFEREGEPGFRLREAEALREVSSEGAFVVATGGGAAVRAENRRVMASRGWIIALEGRPETLNERIQLQLKRADPGAIRPMLDAVYPLDQVRALKHSRQSVYALADWTVHTDRLTPGQVAAEVIRARDLLEQTQEPVANADVPATPIRHSLSPDLPPPVVVAAGPWPYQAVVGWNHLHSIGAQVRRILPRARKVATLTDTATWARLGERVTESLQDAGLEVHVREVEPDEHVKTLDQASLLYDWLLELRMRREDIVLVVGGDAIDDLGGFVASTYMRGIPLVKVPTSLEGMVDTAIGGKSALNHKRARNLVGTFHHPRLAWADAALLHDEPERERRAAFAEVVKYAMIESSLMPGEAIASSLLEQVERHVDALLALDRMVLLPVIARCVALKAQVVAADERDLGQLRMLLNYGHTVGHALETATDYRMPHGEAVAIGMAVEARLAVLIGLSTPASEARQNQLLARFGLPSQLPPLSLDLLIELIHRDKKVFGDAPRWILPSAPGRVVVSSAVEDADLRRALTECLTPTA